MNLVLDEAEEVSVKFKSRKALGETDDGGLHKNDLADFNIQLVVINAHNSACLPWVGYADV